MKPPAMFREEAPARMSDVAVPGGKILTMYMATSHSWPAFDFSALAVGRGRTRP